MMFRRTASLFLLFVFFFGMYAAHLEAQTPARQIRLTGKVRLLSGRLGAIPTVFSDPQLGALVYPNTTQVVTGSGNQDPIFFQLEIYDTDNIHSTVSNTDRFTMPGAWVGRYGRVTANVDTDDPNLLNVLKNDDNANYISRRDTEDYGAAGQARNNIMSAPFIIATNDYYQADTGTLLTITNANSLTWGYFELLPLSFKGALVSQAASQSVGTSYGVLTFDTEEFDTNAFWDAGNPTKFVVPSGVTKIRVYGECYMNAGALTLKTQVNGLDAIGGMAYRSETASTDHVSGWSGILEVSPGDEITVLATNTTAGSCSPARMAVEALSSTKRYASVYRDTSLLVNTGTTIIAWDGVLHDPEGLFDGSTKFTVPAGVSKVRLGANMAIPSGDEGFMMFRKNGAQAIGTGGLSVDITLASTKIFNIHSAIIQVSPGDEFDLRLDQVNSATLAADGAFTWFEMEIIE